MWNKLDMGRAAVVAVVAVVAAAAVVVAVVPVDDVQPSSFVRARYSGSL